MARARLELEADSGQIRKATRDLSELERQGKKSERSTVALTRSVKLMGAALAAAAGAALIQSSRNIATFSQAVADLSAITGATGDDLEYFAEQAKEIGRTTSLSASQSVTAFKLIASAQPDLLNSAEALTAVTREAVTLAEAAGIELPAAASALGSAINQFSLDADQANEVINILAASAQLGAAEIPAVTEALRNAGPAANALGVDLAETVAGIQALATSGRQGADAGTGLRQVLLRLEKTADSDLQPSIVGLSSALETLRDRNLSNTELMKLFGDEAFSAATALLEQSDVVSDLNVNLRGTDTATEQAATRMDTLRGDTLELSAALEGLSIELGERLEPALRASTQLLTTFINRVNEALPDAEDAMRSLLEQERNTLERLEGELNTPRLLRINPFIPTEEIERQLQEQRAIVQQLDQDYQRFIWTNGASAPSSSGMLETQGRVSSLINQGQGGGRDVMGGENADDDFGSTINVQADQVEAVDLIAQRYGELERIAQRTNQELRTPQEIFNDEIELLNELKETRKQGTDEALISQENYVRGVEEAQQRLEDATTSTSTLVEEAAVQAARNMQDNFAEFFMFTEDGFEGLAKSALRSLQEIAANIAANQLISAIAGGLSGSDNAFLSSIGGAIAGERAIGGPVTAGKSYLVGERGPEVFTPAGSGSITPNGAGAVTVNVNVSDSGVSSESSDGSSRQLGRLIGNSVRSILVDEKRPGGLLDG